MVDIAVTVTYRNVPDIIVMYVGASPSCYCNSEGIIVERGNENNESRFQSWKSWYNFLLEKSENFHLCSLFPLTE